MIHTIIVMFILWFILMSFMIYYSHLNHFLKLLALPLFLVIGLFTYKDYVKALGAPIARELPQEFDYRSHIIAGERLIIWIKDEDRERLYDIPYDREAAKALEEAKEKQESSQGGAHVERKTDAKTGEVTWHVDDVKPEPSEMEEMK